jgi:predicted ATPase
MGALAHQRGLLTLHASAVEVDGRCVLFAGESGSGKSTITAAFHDRGYRIVTDDISVVRFKEDGNPVVNAGHRRVKLWVDVLEHVGESLGDRRKPRIGIQKYSVTTPGPVPGAPLRLARMFVFSPRSAQVIELRSLTGRSKVAAVVTETYRRRMLTALGQSSTHFAQCAAFARRVPLVAVDRPMSLDGLGLLVDVLENDIRAGDQSDVGAGGSQA